MEKSHRRAKANFAINFQKGIELNTFFGIPTSLLLEKKAPPLPKATLLIQEDAQVLKE